MVALDHRGHGRGIRSRRPFRLEDCADDVAALIEQLATGPVTAVGYSMGGPIAQLLWQRHPDLVKGLVLCATAARFAGRAELNGPVGALGYGMALALSGLPADLLRPGYGIIVRNRAAEQGVAAWAIAEWERNDPAALIQAGFALSRFDSTEWIAAIDVPTSVVVTTLDATVEPSRQWHLAQSIPGATAFPVAGDPPGLRGPGRAVCAGLAGGLPGRRAPRCAPCSASRGAGGAVKPRPRRRAPAGSPGAGGELGPRPAYASEGPRPSRAPTSARDGPSCANRWVHFAPWAHWGA